MLNLKYKRKSEILSLYGTQQALYFFCLEVHSCQQVDYNLLIDLLSALVDGCITVL